jgi:hypothetical protein
VATVALLALAVHSQFVGFAFCGVAGVLVVLAFYGVPYALRSMKSWFAGELARVEEYSMSRVSHHLAAVEARVGVRIDGVVDGIRQETTALLKGAIDDVKGSIPTIGLGTKITGALAGAGGVGVWALLFIKFLRSARAFFKTEKREGASREAFASLLVKFIKFLADAGLVAGGALVLFKTRSVDIVKMLRDLYTVVGFSKKTIDAVSGSGEDRSVPFIGSTSVVSERYLGVKKSLEGLKRIMNTLSKEDVDMACLNIGQTIGGDRLKVAKSADDWIVELNKMFPIFAKRTLSEIDQISGVEFDDQGFAAILRQHHTFKSFPNIVEGDPEGPPAINETPYVLICARLYLADFMLHEANRVNCEPPPWCVRESEKDDEEVVALSAYQRVMEFGYDHALVICGSTALVAACLAFAYVYYHRLSLREGQKVCHHCDTCTKQSGDVYCDDCCVDKSYYNNTLNYDDQKFLDCCVKCKHSPYCWGSVYDPDLYQSTPSVPHVGHDRENKKKRNQGSRGQRMKQASEKFFQDAALAERRWSDEDREEMEELKNEVVDAARKLRDKWDDVRTHGNAEQDARIASEMEELEFWLDEYYQGSSAAQAMRAMSRSANHNKKNREGVAENIFWSTLFGGIVRFAVDRQLLKVFPPAPVKVEVVKIPTIITEISTKDGAEMLLHKSEVPKREAASLMPAIAPSQPFKRDPFLVQHEIGGKWVTDSEARKVRLENKIYMVGKTHSVHPPSLARGPSPKVSICNLLGTWRMDVDPTKWVGDPLRDTCYLDLATYNVPGQAISCVIGKPPPTKVSLYSSSGESHSDKVEVGEPNVDGGEIFYRCSTVDGWCGALIVDGKTLEVVGTHGGTTGSDTSGVCNNWGHFFVSPTGLKNL